MTTAAARRFEISPAAIGSVALHAAVAAAFMISWGARDLRVGSVVPVNIVSSAPDIDTRPAEQGPETLPAMTEDPMLEAPLDPAPPPELPAPAAKAAEPATKAPAPRPAPKQAESSFDLDALAESLTRPARNQPQRPSAAQKGASRPETAPTARQTAGTGLAAGAALQGLAEELQRRWNPNCEVEGGGNVVVRTVFQLGVGGQVVGDVKAEIQGARTPVSQAAADRAVRAVYAAAPFRGLPRDFYGQRIAVNFNAREACAR
ncbi:MAG: energy transducer TonB [Pseudomonadota bacterium]